MLKVAGGGASAGAVKYLGTWNANTNTPTLTSGVGSQGSYYVVSVAGSTNLDGITDWQPGDWAIFNGTVWQKVDNSEIVYVSNVATGTGLTGGPITTTGTISLANTTVTAGVYGDAATVPQVTFNAQGQATNVANVAISISVANVANAVPDTREITAGTGLTGGGNLSANVSIALANTAVVVGTYGGGSNAAEVTVDAQGRITSAANVAIPQGTVTQVDTGTGLTGGPITSNGTIALANTSVTAGTYGSNVAVAQVQVDAQGRITNASNVTIEISSANVSGLGTMSAQNANAVAITGGNITGLSNLSASNASITGGNITGLSNLSAANVVITNSLSANLSSSNTAAMPDPSLPLNPEGYISVTINGVAKKIPYYGV